MKDGAILANSGHFNVEINIAGADRDERVTPPRPRKRRGVPPDGRRASSTCSGEGRLINLAAAEGHPASVMDMSFANQALCVEHIARQETRLPVDVHVVPPEIDKEVARLKLETMGIRHRHS